MSGVVARVRSKPVSIFPFDEPVSSLIMGGPSLRDLQEQEAQKLGLSVVDVELGAELPANTRIVAAEDVAFTSAALASLLSHGKRARCVLSRGTALHDASTRLLDDEAADLRVPLLAGSFTRATFDGVDAEDVVVGGAGAVEIDVRPWGVAPHVLRVADVDAFVCWPRHWVHVLDGSLGCARSLLRQQKKAKPKKKPSVHPTALVENSILGSGVRVDAHCAVIDSVLGDDVSVADHTVIHSSVIGARCKTLVDTHLRRCVAMPGSTLSNLDMQDAVFGSEVFVTTGVAFFPEKPGMDVVVDGRSSKRAVLSGAIGTRTVLGSRALLRSGVALPPRILVVARPGEALGKFDDVSLAKAGAHNIRSGA